MPIQVMPLSAAQCADLRTGYSKGGVWCEPLGNLVREDAMPPVWGVENVSIPYLDPVHFNFTGNRAYKNQLVSNGECFALLSMEKLSNEDRKLIGNHMARAELVLSSSLPFAKVSTRPTVQQVRAFYADLVGYLVEQHQEWAKTASPGAIKFSEHMAAGPSAFGVSLPNGKRKRVLAGEDPRVVLADWLNAPVPLPSKKSKSSPSS